MYVVQEIEPGVFTVGFFTPSSQWHPESDYDNSDAAVNRMRFLNGAPEAKPPQRAKPAAAAGAPPKK